ncbi:MAG TPA: hypothetical protein VLT87_26580 [Thermoanaerobaculia bacterium]|nr:hypothetical protein [Thermoanaerobaculia bacterium]
MRALRERGLSKREIGRELDLDIKAVRKWLRQKWEPQRRPGRSRELDRWESFLRGRAPEVGFNAAVLYRELKAQGYEGSYPSLVDWGSAWVWLGQQRVRVHVFTMVLGYSRRIFARGYSREGLDSLLEGHVHAFEHFGGRTQTILYDNPRTIVLSKDESSGWVEWNTPSSRTGWTFTE